MTTTAITLDDEPLSRLDEPLPIPPYEFDDSLSEDENFLTWVSILARHSSSRKGHMGTIFVKPPTYGDPSDEARGCSSCQPPARQRVLHYANNTPLLYSRLQKAVPEVHAEALAISRCARRGIALEGCTVYVSFPPCNECFRLLLSAGVRRCVYKKGILNKDAQGEASLVAAHVYGLTLCGTLDKAIMCQSKGDADGAAKEKASEREQDERRDQRVRSFWASVGEDAARTRARVARWWDDYTVRYRDAEKVIRQQYGSSGVEQAEKRRESEREARKVAKREVLAQRATDKATQREDEEDEQFNTSGKREGATNEDESPSAKVIRTDEM